MPWRQLRQKPREPPTRRRSQINSPTPTHLSRDRFEVFGSLRGTVHAAVTGVGRYEPIDCTDL